MVSNASIIAICVTLFISLFLPLIIWVIYGAANKNKGIWTAWLLGAAGFFVTQIMVRVPIVSVLSSTKGFNSFVENNYVLYGFVLAFTAGLFELVGRYAVAKIMSKNLTPERSLAAGLGHGGIEAIVIIGMSYIANLIMALMINGGAFDTLIQATMQQGADAATLEALELVKTQLVETSSGLIYLAGFERILTMIFHAAMTMIVCYYVSRKKDIIGILICLAMHTALDFSLPIINGMATDYLGNVISQNTAYILLYSLLTVFAIASVFIIIKIMKSWNNSAEETAE